MSEGSEIRGIQALVSDITVKVNTACELIEEALANDDDTEALQQVNDAVAVLKEITQ